MIKNLVKVIISTLLLSSCGFYSSPSEKSTELKNNSKNLKSKNEIKAMKNTKLNEISNEIKKSNVYEKTKNWEKRGLNPSGVEIIKILRTATNNFLNELVKINDSNLSNGSKLKEINKLVDNLPWNELDTEEKEFLADVLAPAIEASGFNPWDIF